MDRLTSVYGKPLARDLGLTPGRALERLRRIVLKKVRDKLLTAPLSGRAKRAFLHAFQAKVEGSKLTISSTHPAFKLLLKGQRPGTMNWLRPVRVPIPIATEKGELIFRYPTARSFAQGKWRHPGRPKLTFLDRAKEEAKKELKQQVTAEIRRTVLAVRLRGAR